MHPRVHGTAKRYLKGCCCALCLTEGYLKYREGHRVRQRRFRNGKRAVPLTVSCLFCDAMFATERDMLIHETMQHSKKRKAVR